MARYCFYCGRELTAGEKCNCRSSGKAAGGKDQSSDPKSTAGRQPHQHNHAGKKATRQKSANVFKRFFNAFNPFASATATQPKAGAPGKRSDGRPSGKARTARPARKPLTGRDALLAVRRFGRYLISPADSIREAVRAASGRSVLLILLVQGFCGGFFLLAASGIPLIRSLLSLSMATLASEANPAISFFIFFQGFGISIAATLLLVLLYQLALRFLYRKPTAYFTLLAGFSPSVLYFSIFLLAGLLTISTSVFSAMLLVLAGFAIATAAQHLAINEISGFDQNRSFVLVTFVMLIYTSVLSLLLNLSLPFLKVLIDQTTVF